jgi:predicted dehydrogenase
MYRPVTIAILGAGKRGEAYAQFASLHPELAKVVAVAEPREIQRERMAAEHDLPSENCFSSYEDFAALPRMADAVIVCTQDRMHLATVEAVAPLGYSILLEKPMSPLLSDCERIIECVKKHGNLFAVCHVLLYTDFTRKLREIVRSGAIGDIVNVQHFEPVGWWHQAHSFVRGNWSKEADSSFMLMAKSCHDIDWMRHIVNKPCNKVSSFGSLRHFKASEKPEGAGSRCWDCKVESNCPYSAKRLYYTHFGRDNIIDYLNDVITDGKNTREAVEQALHEGPYGRCVYDCDNDVVDNQTVMLEYEGPVSATFTMTAFTPAGHRATRLCGTRGYIETDSVTIRVFDFLTEKETVHTPGSNGNGSSAASGHGGGDYNLMQSFILAVATGDTSEIYSGPDQTLESHRIVFAAEQSRRENRLIELHPAAI